MITKEDLKNVPKQTVENEIAKCPKCNCWINDLWELNFEDETEIYNCPQCDEELLITKTVTIMYTSISKKEEEEYNSKLRQYTEQKERIQT